MYNLSHTELLLLACCFGCCWLNCWINSCTVLYNTLNMCLVACISGCWFLELTGCLLVTFGGTLGSSVDDSLDGAYLGRFNLSRFVHLNRLPSISRHFSKGRDFRPTKLIWQIGQIHPCMNRIHIQPHTGTEDIIISWLEWLTFKEAIWVQYQVKFKIILLNPSN